MRITKEITCSCGGKIPVGHRFCGHCGKPATVDYTITDGIWKISLSYPGQYYNKFYYSGDLRTLLIMIDKKFGKDLKNNDVDIYISPKKELTADITGDTYDLHVNVHISLEDEGVVLDREDIMELIGG